MPRKRYSTEQIVTKLRRPSVNTSKAAIDRHFKTGHHTCGERDGLRSTAGSPGASSAHVDHGFPGRGYPTRIVVCVHVGDDGLWSLWRRVRRPKRCGKRAPPRRSSSRACDRVFHIAGGIQRPSGATRPTRMPQERRPRPRPPCNYPPLQPLSRMVRISGRAVAGVYGAAFVRRRDGSVSARRCAAGSPRSLVASVWLGSPITPGIARPCAVWSASCAVHT